MNDTAASCAVAVPAGPPDVILRAQQGDMEAYAALYREYRPFIMRFIYARVRDWSVTEDLTSETFLRALRRIGTFTWQGRDIGAWLATIARNLVADHFKSGRLRFEITAYQPHLDLRHAIGAGADPALDVIGGYSVDSLYGALNRISSDQRDCLILRFLYGLSNIQTAEVMGRNVGAVKALQFRAIRAMAQMIPRDSAARPLPPEWPEREQQ